MGNRIISKSSPIRDVGGFTDFTEEEYKKLSYRGFTEQELDFILDNSPSYKQNNNHKSKIVPMPINPNKVKKKF